MKMKAWGEYRVFFRGAGFLSESRVSAPSRERAHEIVAGYPHVVAVQHSIETKQPEVGS